MKLYLFTHANPSYDQTNNLIIRAKNEEQARDLIANYTHSWNNLSIEFKNSTCVELVAEGQPAILIIAE